MTVKSVTQAIKDLARIHEDRRPLYGDDFLHVGEVMLGLFPRGLTLRTSVDFNRFVLLVHQVTKVSRYAQCMAKGQGHPDSLDDISVYAQLLQHFDSLVVERVAQERAAQERREEAQPERPEEPESQSPAQPEARPEAPQPPPVETQEAEVKKFPSPPPPIMPRAAFTARVLTPVGGRAVGSKS